MSDHLVLWIAGTAFLSLGLVWLQYYFRSKPVRNRRLLAALRFLSIWALLLLLLNPQLNRQQIFVDKHEVLVLLDNSSSIRGEAEQSAVRDMRDLAGDEELTDRVDLVIHTFGTDLSLGDSLHFNDTGTDISRALTTLSRSRPEGNASIVLVSDGNENLGRSYLYQEASTLPVFPVVVGDTTRHRDLRIDQVNLNRYAFLGNRYPVEILASYSGDLATTATLRILDNGRGVYSNELRFPAGGGSQRLEVLVEASSVGYHRLEAVLSELEGEQNVRNNRSVGGLEVIDERVDIKLVTLQSHPDIGALKRSILSNQQREFEVVSPAEALTELDRTDLLILFEPDARFGALYAALENRDIPIWTIAGPDADWRFLGNAQKTFQQTQQGPDEEILAEPNAAFSYFDLSEWEVGAYPPLDGSLGSYLILPEHQVVLGQRVRGVSMDEPLLALVKGTKREALLLGRGLWKWRMSDFRSNGSFEYFDSALGKILLFLTAEGTNSRLTLDYQAVYRGLGTDAIRARFFDESFRFDPEASLSLRLTDSTGQQVDSRPLALRRDYYEAGLGGLQAGTYRFEVTETASNLSASGQFNLLTFDLEAQQISSDARKLGDLAQQTGGQLFYASSRADLRDSLLLADRFRPVQKSRRNVVSLIDYRWLLLLLVLTLGSEWAIRKYNGLL